MLTARSGAAAAALNGKIFVMGGENPSDQILDTVEVYDPAADTWTALASMNSPREGTAAAAINGKIYVIGGSDDLNMLNTIEEYDPVANTWTTISVTMESPREDFAAVAIHGKIYIFGGVSDVGGESPIYQDKIESYDPVRNDWEVPFSGFNTGSYLAATALNGEIYIIGGEIDGTGQTTVDVFLP